METTGQKHAEDSEAAAQPTKNLTERTPRDLLVGLTLAVEDLKSLTGLTLTSTVYLLRLTNPPPAMVSQIEEMEEVLEAFLTKLTVTE